MTGPRLKCHEGKHYFGFDFSINDLEVERCDCMYRIGERLLTEPEVLDFLLDIAKYEYVTREQLRISIKQKIGLVLDEDEEKTLNHLRKELKNIKKKLIEISDLLG